MKSLSAYALVGLRVAMGGLFAFFGVLAVTNPARQRAQWMAEWVQNLPALGPVLSSEAFIIAWGVFQLLLATALILGLYLRVAGWIAAAALALITINLGFNDSAYRDAVLVFAAAVIATSTNHKWALRP